MAASLTRDLRAATVIHPAGLPELSSNPGAAYTLYLDFSGFAFTGTWGPATPISTPGRIMPYLGVTTTFSASQQLAIQRIYSKVADKYSAFNINVTTIDPALSAGKANTDPERQAYYDSQARVMHTAIGDSPDWALAAGGVSYIDVASSSFPTTTNGGAGDGIHTNFVFTDGVGTGYQNIGEAAAHENGHALNLDHQSDYNAGVKSNEYSSNGGSGLFAPVMGNSYSAQRGLWRIGLNSSNVVQNDVAVLLSNSGMTTFRDDGIGHSAAAATSLPQVGSTVDFGSAAGVIRPNPVGTAAPAAIGEANYTSDYWKFTSTGAAIALTLNCGQQLITPGAQDPRGMFLGKLEIVDAAGSVYYSAAASTSTLIATITASLAAGTYYARVASAGGQTGTVNGYSSEYFDMGGYFLTGTGVSGGPQRNLYWKSGATTSKWNQVDGSITTNWRQDRTGTIDPAQTPATAINVFLGADSGVGTMTMTLGAATTINSLNFTGSNTAAGTTSVNLASDGFTLRLRARNGYMDGNSATYAAGTGLVVAPGSVAHTIGANVSYDMAQTWKISNLASNPLTINGALTNSGTAGNTITKIGEGKLVIGGTTDNTNTALRIQAGKLVLGKTSTASVHSVGLSNGSPALVIEGGTVQLAGSGGDQISTGSGVRIMGGALDMNGTNEGWARLYGEAGVIRNDLVGTTSLLTLGQSNGNSAYGGTITDGIGSVALTKTGTGTLTLTGSSAYTGATNASNGRLELSGNYNPAVTSATTLTAASTGTVSVAGSASFFSVSSPSINTTVDGVLNIKSTSTANVSTVQKLTGLGTVNLDKGTLVNTLAPRIGTLSITGGGVTVLSATDANGATAGTQGSAAGIMRVSGLSISSTSKLDLKNNGIIIPATGKINGSGITVTNLRSLLVAGRGGTGTGAANWTSAGGIGTSLFNFDETFDSLGYIWTADPNLLVTPATLNGESLSTGDFLVKYCAGADADLNGVVNDIDVAVIGLTYDQGATSGRQWYEGDFNYDGLINDDDVAILGLSYSPGTSPLSPSFYSALASEYGSSFAAAFSAGSSGGVVPEPTSIGLLGITAIGLLRRRRRAS